MALSCAESKPVEEPEGLGTGTSLSINRARAGGDHASDRILQPAAQGVVWLEHALELAHELQRHAQRAHKIALGHAALTTSRRSAGGRQLFCDRPV